MLFENELVQFLFHALGELEGNGIGCWDLDLFAVGWIGANAGSAALLLEDAESGKFNGFTTI